MTGTGTTEKGTDGVSAPDNTFHLDEEESSGLGWPRRGFALLSGARKNNGMLSLADQMAASGTNFLTGIIIARNCSKEEFGLYMLCFSIVLFALDVQTSLISSPYMVYSPRFRARRRAVYLGSSFFQQFLLMVLILLVLVAGIQITGYDYNPNEIRSVLVALSLVVWPVMLREFIRRVCFAGLEMTTAFRVDCAVLLVQVGSLLLLSSYDLLSAGTAFYCIGFACSLSSLGWLIVYRSSYTFRKKFIRVDFRKNLSFGKWIFASSLLWALSMSLYPWMLAFFHGTAATGVWAACWGVIAIANPLLLGIQNYLGPKIVQSYTSYSSDGLYRFVMRSSLLYGGIILPLAIALFIFGGQLVAILYGEKYGGNGLVISILAVHLLIMAVSFSSSRALLVLEKARLYFMANIVALIVMLTCGIFLVKQFGVKGVALGLLVGAAATATIMFVFFLVLMKTERGAGTANG